MRQTFSRPFDRAYHEIHGSRPRDDFADCAIPHEAVGKTRGGTFTLRERWRGKTPLARVLWVFSAAAVGLVSMYAAMILVAIIGALAVVVSA